MAKKPAEGSRKSTANPKVTSKDANFTENRGNTISPSGPIKVAAQPPTKPAVPPSTSKKSEDGKK
ncbi:hypothetical protein ACWGE0_11935 [Lentzea sp. NPDC054927]